jgi:hypothetical protein
MNKVACPLFLSLGLIPHDDQDFRLPIEELKAKYPEISVYEKKGFSFGYRTPIKEVIDQWGEADKQSIQLLPHGLMLTAITTGGIASGGITGPLIGTVIVLGMYPVPASVYSWKKGDYVIEAVVDSSIFGGYMKRLWFWEWKNKKEVKTIKE